MSDYPYGASYYARALEAIRRRLQRVDDIGLMVDEVRYIADEALHGTWDEDESEED